MVGIWDDSRRSSSAGIATDHRNPFEHDFDRLLFSTPVRRLADKTQVFPLDRNDGVRTRLTHSHEVANLARSLGMRLIRQEKAFQDVGNREAIPAILSAIGLAHDLGNPPFGHQGEAAIGHWFKKNQHWIFTDQEGKKLPPDEQVPPHLWPEFLEFEGNAQTLRIVARLQVAVGNHGLDLTSSTLAALLKYTVSCDQRDASNSAAKKFGYFESEYEIVKWIREKTGIPVARRHPLTWLMEAADDIAYSVLDIEDSMHKGMLSPDDVCTVICDSLPSNYDQLKDTIKNDFQRSHGPERSIYETREIKVAYLRTRFIQKMIDDVVASYEDGERDIVSFERTSALLDGNDLCKLLKSIAKEYVFATPAVRKVEADGYISIDKLMDFFWRAISERKDFKDLRSKRLNAIASYGYSKVSDNYLQCAQRGNWLDREGNPLPMRYRELRLLTDMMAGMTDGFAQDTCSSIMQAGFLDLKK